MSNGFKIKSRNRHLYKLNTLRIVFQMQLFIINFKINKIMCTL